MSLVIPQKPTALNTSFNSCLCVMSERANIPNMVVSTLAISRKACLKSLFYEGQPIRKKLALNKGEELKEFVQL